MQLQRAIRVLLLTTFGIHCYIFPSALFLLVTNQVPPGQEWMATLMLIVEGVVALTWVVTNYGIRRGLRGGLAVLGLGFMVESVGETTGFPFGTYQYTDLLHPKLGTVPVGIMFAWLMIVLASFYTAQLILARIKPDASFARIIGLAVFLILISDLLMEPVAFHVQGYWLWSDGFMTGYYGVPLTNFVAWVVTGFIMITILSRITGVEQHKLSLEAQKLRYSFIPPVLFMMNLILFTAVNLSQKFFLAGSIGVVVGIGCAYFLLRRLTFNIPNPLAERMKDEG
jgi:putative membrane protein